MKDVYATLLLHSAGQPINEENVKKVLTAAGINEDATKIKALVASLEGVNIDEAIKQAAFAPTASAASAGAGEAKKEEKKEEASDAEKEAEAAAGLASLFG
ncbi:50S ribosomal protein P1 [Candidatus Micrarchaeota archaeon]|nr:50S ribosomal protein P1 [Candidatus Micrarchaeota archaeon]